VAGAKTEEWGPLLGGANLAPMEQLGQQAIYPHLASVYIYHIDAFSRWPMNPAGRLATEVKTCSTEY